MNPQRLINSFFTMVAIESPSWHEAAMAKHCARELENMGFSVAFDDSARVTGSDTGNLIAYLPGTVPGRIAFSAHMDTVEPCANIRPVVVREVVEGSEVDVVRSAGDTILSADDKAGVAAIFEGVRSIVESGASRPDIVVLLTTCEEQSLLGASAFDPDVLASLVSARGSLPVASSAEYRTNVSRETFVNAEDSEAEGGIEVGDGGEAECGIEVGGGDAAENSDETSSGDAAEADRVPCFVMDADGHPGSIVVGAPFHYTMRATFTGRAAHAGVEPEAGTSAIQMASRAIADMPLGRIDERTTANVGVIEGGSAVNVVAATCRIEGECRSLYEDRAEAQRRAMTKACEQAAKLFGGEVNVEWTLDYPGILFDENAPLVRHLVQAAEAAGLKAWRAISGGGADANVLFARGFEAITLGVGMTNFHSTDEYIAVRDLENSARYVEAIIAEYAR